MNRNTAAGSAAIVFVWAFVALASGQDRPAATEAAATTQTTQPALLDLMAQVAIQGLPADAPIWTNRSGFCLDLGCGDGTLSREIAQRTRLTVFALAKDEAQCGAARKTLDSAKLYGSRATCVAGSLAKLPLPNGYGNLIVTGEYDPSLDLREVVRVLNPNGLAIIGGPKTDAAKLKAALEAVGVKDGRISGNHVIFRGRMPEGVDEWTHFSHGPDNIQTSKETNIRPPFITQWYLSRPTYDDKAVDHVAIEHGRMIYHAAVSKPNPDRIYALDTFNGTMQWDLAVKSRNNLRFALVDDVYYWADMGVIGALDAVTGQKRGEYQLPGDKASFQWIAVQDGMVYGAGQTAGAKPSVFGAAQVLCAFDIKSREMKWKRVSEQPALAFSCALDPGGGLYYTTIDLPEKAPQGKGTAYALDARTGEERWHADLGPISARLSDASVAGCIDGKYFVWCTVDAKGVTGAKALSAKTGELVKDYPGLRSWGEGTVAPLDFVGGKIYANTTAGHAAYTCVDMASGEKVKSAIDNLRAHDNPGHASATCLYSGGEGGSVQDLLNGRNWYDPFVRPGDYSSPYPAEGLLITFPSVCHCPHMFGAPKAVAPAGLDWTPPAADADMESRLVKGPAFSSPLIEDAKSGWTHYRGNAGHTGETTEAIGTGLKVGWSVTLSGKLTAPSFGQKLGFVGSRDAAVYALDEASGDIKWRFLCGAGVNVTPAYGRGRVVFGSDDGWVYCLEATSGQLVWKFRAAPQERYINAEGQMQSTWPSTAGVIIDGASVYCAAGLLSYDGGYLYSLDLGTGKPAWAKRIGGPEQLAGAPHGVMALAGETLVLPVFAARQNSAYRKSDGERLEWFKGGARFYWTFGSEAVADGDVFFYGGPRRSDDDWRAGHAPFTLMDLATGWPYGKAAKGPGGIGAIDIAPVLGRTMILGDATAYDRAKYCQTLQSDQPDTAKAAATLWSAKAWPDKSQKTSGLALAANAALIAGTSEVVAVDRAKDGQQLARLKIPGTIQRNSLSISGNKAWIVTQDGSVVCLGEP